MDVNYVAIVLLAVGAMVIGAIWYGPLFGKAWMRVLGADPADEAKRKEMQKSAGPLYLIQFVLVLFQVYVLAHYIRGWEEASGVVNALWIWAAFVMPTIAACSMWTNDPKRVVWTRFFIQSGYFLVLFVLFGYVLGTWG